MITFFDTNNNSQKTLRGLYHQGNKPNIIPIIIVHGFFSSNKIGPYRLYYLIAEQLRNTGKNVYRVDFSAMGESDGIAEDIIFDDHVNDLSVIINMALNRSNTKKVHILAHCFGCCTALAYLKDNIEKIESVTFLSPFIPQDDSFQRLLGKDEWESFKNEVPIYHRGMYCDRSFIDKGFVLTRKEYLLSLHAIDFMVYIPQNDEFCTAESSIKWANINSLKYRIIDQGDHNYLKELGRHNLFNALNDRYNSLDY